MVLPVVMVDPGQGGGHHHHGAALAAIVPDLPGLAAAMLHTAGYLLVMGAVALVVTAGVVLL